MEQLTVERWGMLELSLPGKTAGNPFTDYEIRGRTVHRGKGRRGRFRLL